MKRIRDRETEAGEIGRKRKTGEWKGDIINIIPLEYRLILN